MGGGLKPSEQIQKIREALVFASREDYKHLPMIKGLEVMILSQVNPIASSQTPISEVATQLTEFFRGFDDSDLSEKRKRIALALSVLDIAESGQGHDNGTRSPRRPLPDRETRQACRAILNAPVTSIKGVGPSTERLLALKGIRSVQDLLCFPPRCYEDRRRITRIAEAVSGRSQMVIGTVTGCGVKWYGRRKLFEASVKDTSGTLTAKWFNGNERYLRSQLISGKSILLIGEIRSSGFGPEVIHPEFEILEDGEDRDYKGNLNFGRIVPVYSETEGLHQKVIRKIIHAAVEQYLDKMTETLPEGVRHRHRLCDLVDAIRTLHEPDEMYREGETSGAIRTLIFEEFFYFQLAMALRARGVLAEDGISFNTNGSLMTRFHRTLPFSLTGAQRRVIETILEDMRVAHPMNRLVHGDVGCGKTVVAMSAMVTACENGWQSAMMAPTEILAEQHFRQIDRWAQPLGLKTSLLTGKLKAADHERLREDIREGRIDIVIGTQALIQEGIVFKRLGLVVVDEQHRFGVMQRATLRQKGRHPDVLFMTATPIPRTLALTVYGDLQVSMIDEMPPGKKDIRTKVFQERQRNAVYEVIRKEVEKGRQVFIVYPLVEASEKLDLRDATRMGETLKREVFPQYRVEVLHGQMRSEAKDQIMQDFAAGAIQILVSTTVVEVGIDVPNASLMVVEHAERFGLSQLHQLRGRVGRSDIQSYVILMTGTSRTDIATRRLRMMEQTNDGFLIAEEDLAIRGAGEFLGVKQSGLPDFRLGNIIRDHEIMSDARSEAFALVHADPEMRLPEHAVVLETLRERWGDRLLYLEAG